MDETGDASNAGMSQHRYTLSGNQYTVSIIDSEGSPISVYALNAPFTICIPFSDVEMLSKNSDGTLTALSSSQNA